MSEQRYGRYTIYYDPPPIPLRQFDWRFVHDDYDGAPNEPDGPPGDSRCGAEASPAACRAEIDAIEGELAETEGRAHPYTEETCPDHVGPGKVCKRCGVHVDSLHDEDFATAHEGNGTLIERLPPTPSRAA
jgi:hypothetical protein